MNFGNILSWSNRKWQVWDAGGAGVGWQRMRTVGHQKRRNEKGAKMRTDASRLHAFSLRTATGQEREKRWKGPLRNGPKAKTQAIPMYGTQQPLTWHTRSKNQGPLLALDLISLNFIGTRIKMGQRQFNWWSPLKNCLIKSIGDFSSVKGFPPKRQGHVSIWTVFVHFPPPLHNHPSPAK